MNCVNHPEAPAIAYCRECGKALCGTCRRQADGTIYCEQHAPGAAAWPATPAAPSSMAPGFAPAAPGSPYTQPESSPYQSSEPSAYQAPDPSPYTAPTSAYSAPSPYTAPAPPPPPVRSDAGASPGLAFLLGFIPGVGAIYNGQYVKGLIHVVVLGLLISITSNEDLSGNLQPLFGMMIALWVFYMAFEAYHTAKKRQLGQPVDEFSSILPRSGHPARFPLAPTLLIAVGILFLLHNLNILRISELIRYWPVGLIGLGAYMLYDRLSARPEPRQQNTTGTQGVASEATDERR